MIQHRWSLHFRGLSHSGASSQVIWKLLPNLVKLKGHYDLLSLIKLVHFFIAVRDCGRFVSISKEFARLIYNHYLCYLPNAMIKVLLKPVKKLLRAEAF